MRSNGAIFATMVFVAASGTRAFGKAPAPSPAPAPTTNPCAGLLAELNRPTIGYSPCVAQRRTAVLELGAQWLSGGHGSSEMRQTQAPQGFLRFGVADNFELDVIGPNVLWQSDGVRSVGLADSGIGFKYSVPPTQRWQLGIDGLYTSPNGARAFTTGNAAYTFNFDTSYGITPNTSVGATLSIGSTGGFGQSGAHVRYGEFMPSFLVIEQINDISQAYIEYVDVSRVSPDVGNRAFFDAGIQYLLTANLELDVEYGRTITGAPALHFDYFGAGFGVLVNN